MTRTEISYGRNRVELTRKSYGYLLRVNFAPWLSGGFTGSLRKAFGGRLEVCRRNADWMADGLPWGYEVYTEMPASDVIELVGDLLTDKEKRRHERF